MIYIERDEQGNIKAIRRYEGACPEGLEELNSENLTEFLLSDDVPDSLYKNILGHMDSEFVRVLDDLVDVLVKKNVILLSDLPEGARRKIYDRKSVRLKLKYPQVIVDDIL